MNLEDIIFIDSLPTIDLHGYDKDYARMKIKEFIKDNKKLKNSIIAIVHGRGLGILKKETDKDVLDYKLFYNNTGVTIVKIKIDKY